MAVVPFIGPSYRYRSVNFDAQRSVNLYPIKSEVGDSKAISALVGTPGKETFCQVDKNQTRGSHEVFGRGFFVVGTDFFELFADGSSVSRGTLNSLSGLVTIADNGLQIMLVDGEDGYIFTLADNDFEDITDDDFPGASTVTFLDGYFVVNKPDTAEFYISGLYDGLLWDSLDFATAEAATDNLVCVKAVRGDLWLLGQASTEMDYNSGDADFPFSPIQGTVIEYGCAAKGSVAVTGNTVFWLGLDKDGSSMIWMANGYQPQRISTDAIEFAIQQYNTITDAVAYTYQEDGHYFYVLNFTNANTTWVYDIRMNEWHERAFWNIETGAYERDRGQAHIFCFKKHLVGDFETGKIYEQSLDIYDDDGSPLRRMRTAPHLSDDLEYLFFQEFQLDMETGIGLSHGESQNITPQVMLRWSDDGGHVWSDENWRSAGKIGQYKHRVIWRMLGRSRDRVFQVAFSAKCKVFLIAAHARVERGMY